MISGFSKSGKDLMADYMVETLNFKKYAIASSLKQMMTQKYNIVISDFRYNNEYEYLCRHFYKNDESKDTKIITVRIDRFDTSPVKSDSEIQLNNFKFDYYIENRSTIFEFYCKIFKFYQNAKYN
jgi:hypothetical protein